MSEQPSASEEIRISRGAPAGGEKADARLAPRKPREIKILRAARFVTLVLLRCVGIGVSAKEIAGGARVSNEPSPQPLTPARDDADEKWYALVEAYVSRIEAESARRQDRIEAKLRGLLTTNGLVISLITGFALNGKPLFLVAAVPLILSSVLAVGGLGVRTFQALSLSADDFAKDNTTLWQTAIDGRLAAADHNATVQDLLVDYFRAANRYFVMALLVAPLTYGASRLIGDDEPRNTTIAVLRAVKSERTIVDMLRGPPGPAGPTGSVGPPGPPGATGASCSASPAPARTPAVLSSAAAQTP